MANIQNNGKLTPIGLPNGVVIEPGKAVEVDDKEWKDMAEKHPVVKHFVAEKVLTEGKQQREASKS